jgi:hypothetical protein
MPEFPAQFQGPPTSMVRTHYCHKLHVIGAHPSGLHTASHTAACATQLDEARDALHTCMLAHVTLPLARAASRVPQRPCHSSCVIRQPALTRVRACFRECVRTHAASIGWLVQSECVCTCWSGRLCARACADACHTCTRVDLDREGQICSSSTRCVHARTHM